MPIKSMTLSSGGAENTGPWTHEEEISAGTSSWIIVPRIAKSVLVALYPVTSGAGTVQYTLDSESRVKAGTATAKAWDSGEVSAYMDDELAPPTAIRLTVASGTMRMILKAVV